MTFVKLLNSPKLKLTLKKFISENKWVFDIVIYGSFIRGKTKIHDLDLAVLSGQRLSLKDKLSLAQALKTKIKKFLPYELDVVCLDFADFQDNTFLARQGILAEGYSLIRNKPLARFFGFEAKTLFVYSLKELSLSQKTIFQYAMKGRRGQKGLLLSRGGESLGKGVILIPLKHSEEFKDLFEKLKIKYQAYPALFY